MNKTIKASSLNTDLEESIIGAFLLAGDHANRETALGRAIGESMVFLEDADFCDERCRRLFGIMRALWESADVWYPISTMVERIRDAEQRREGENILDPDATPEWLAGCAFGAAFASKLPYYARVLRARRIRRELHVLADISEDAAAGGHIAEWLKRIGSQYTEIQRLQSSIRDLHGQPT